MTDAEIEKAFFSLGQIEGIFGYISTLDALKGDQVKSVRVIFDTISDFMSKGANAIRELRIPCK